MRFLPMPSPTSTRLWNSGISQGRRHLRLHHQHRPAPQLLAWCVTKGSIAFNRRVQHGGPTTAQTSLMGACSTANA